MEEFYFTRGSVTFLYYVVVSRGSGVGGLHKSTNTGISPIVLSGTLVRQIIVSIKLRSTGMVSNGPPHNGIVLWLLSRILTWWGRRGHPFFRGWRGKWSL